MNSRSLLVGVLGVVAGVVAGVMAERQLGKRHPSTTAPPSTNVVVAPPKSTFTPIRDIDAPAGRIFKTPGKVSFEEFPNALATVLQQPSSKRYQALFELSERVDQADIPKVLDYCLKNKSQETRNSLTHRLWARWAESDP